MLDSDTDRGEKSDLGEWRVGVDLLQTTDIEQRAELSHREECRLQFIGVLGTHATKLIARNQYSTHSRFCAAPEELFGSTEAAVGSASDRTNVLPRAAGLNCWVFLWNFFRD